MCGIVGYVGTKAAAGVLVEGLEKLEYRGYDSAGIAVMEDHKINVVKAKGRLKNLEQKMEHHGTPFGSIGIGHTRWATHGEPSDVNSHPHGNERVTIVHNGIIENYVQLKEKMIAKGYEFLSETDTEVIAVLLDYYYDGNPVETIIRVIDNLKGSYALGIMFVDTPDTLYAVRKDSPLIVGVGEDENFIASDIPAILKYTRSYYLLEENEIAVLQRNHVTIVDHDNEPVVKELFTATWDIEAAEKGGYPHFMLKEIHEQPKALVNTLSPRMVDGIPDFGIKALSDDILKSFKRIYIVACGTAMHAGMVGKAAIEHLVRIPVEVDVASEFRYRNPILSKEDDLVIIISQSGETADTLAALRLAKDQGVHTLAIVNVVGSSIAREANSVLYTWAGPEIAVASTKAYSVQVAMMYLFAIQLAHVKEMISVDQTKILCAELMEIPQLVERVLETADNCQFYASKFQNAHDIFFIGRGLDYALSLEGSLKLKEISYIHSDAHPAGELKHGTISLITEEMPVIAVATQTALMEKMVSNIKEVITRGAKVLLLCKTGQDEMDQLTDYVIELPKCNDFFTPLLAVVPLQLFAYYTAVLRGCDVDKPRNLAKSVTVE
ncbi:glutamine--fructose-6-phosphate transaminase (isomerizing) [Microbacter margulisiae]|uniref:Glutamine--fructose-6-phosphate aminotransferase [isomerizing] n=1 Tax=Microbacter margulisiae TaxID=1350067 RepID=A0A7W5H391_9PORP|nr:glutamine--fructose-6-phosphate transaminase (isomerizing) [Microbacter margulisiae]MBB3188570.1 glucosamine--fructose-6-phosphate aminotransferase (isomerizing) [Microbacter margulisiae]